LKASSDTSAALRIENEKEMRHQNEMVGTREHDEKMKMSGALFNTARDGKIVVSGQSGQDVLGFYNDAMS